MRGLGLHGFDVLGVVGGGDRGGADALQLVSDRREGLAGGQRVAHPQGKSRDRGGERSRPGDLSVFIGAGAVAGFSPEEVRRMTLAEWHVVIESFIAANSPPDEGSTEDEFIAVLAEEMAAGRA